MYYPIFVRDRDRVKLSNSRRLKLNIEWIVKNHAANTHSSLCSCSQYYEASSKKTCINTNSLDSKKFGIFDISLYSFLDIFLHNLFTIKFTYLIVKIKIIIIIIYLPLKFTFIDF